MIDDPEEEAWLDLERRLKPRPDVVEEAFTQWCHNHRPSVFFVEREAFKAGWQAAMRIYGKK